MKIDLAALQRDIDHLKNGRYMSDADRSALGDRMIGAAPILLEAFLVLAHGVAMGEVVQPTQPDGTPASDCLRDALLAAVKQELADEHD